MKKRILCLFLLISTLLSVFPIVGVAAEETLPKDETPGAQTAPVADGGTLSGYDAMYVGADGTSTANGGTLTALYTAFGSDLSTVDLSAGTWTDKVSGLVATVKGAGWTAGANGGFGYDFAYDQMTKISGNYGISLPETLLSPDLCVETVGMVKSFRNADGTVVNMSASNAVFYNNSTACLASFVRVDLLCSVFFVGLGRGSSENLGNRWYLGYQAFAEHYGKAGKIITYNDAVYASAVLANQSKPVTLGAYYERSTEANGTETYAVGFATGERYTATATAAEKATLAAKKGSTRDKAGLFSFFNGVPSDVYAIRVYSAPLTEAERNHNGTVDILAYAGADPTDYLALDASTRAVVDAMLCAGGFSADRAAVEKRLDDLLAIFASECDVEETLYVTEGLTFFASAYKTLSSGWHGEGNINWVNALNPAESATLRGGFFANENGGLTVIKSPEEYAADKNFGIYMPASALPTADYTVEVVYNPFGLSTRNEDGTVERYVDDVTSTGTHHNMGIAIGPFRALQFACYRPGGKDGQMERRWYYSDTKDLSGLGWNYAFKDTAWQFLPENAVETLSVTHVLGTNASTYQIYNSTARLQTYDVDSENYKTPAQSGNKFQLLLGLAGTAYSVRVYDRALTEEEIAQNRAADIIYYFGLNSAELERLAALMGDTATPLYEAVASLSFTMDAAEAQEALDKAISGAWLAFDGVSVRKDAVKDGLRYYFTYHNDAVRGMVAAGFSVELGAVVNVGKNVQPTLTAGGYDYKIGAYDGASGRNTPFFVDEDTFAVTVLYENVDRKTGLTDVLVLGYVKLTAPDGTETVYYLDPASDKGTAQNLFGVYESVKNTAALRAEVPTYNRILSVIDKCYETVRVYVTAGAAACGDGSAAAPYHSFAEGFAKCKELLLKNNVPAKIYLIVGDGEYGIYETQSLAATEMPYKYTNFEITSASGKSTLTTTKDIGETFTKYADHIWVCQLEKEDGAYPDFRYLYVDGKIADLSYSGGRYIADGNQYVTMYERTYDGPWGRAQEMYKTRTLTADSESGYPAERKDLIAAFEAYKRDFLALMEMEKQYARKELTLDSTCESGDQEYIAKYETYKMRRLVLDDLKKQYAELEGTAAQNKTAFAKFEPKDYSTAEYKAAFYELRKTISALESVSFGPYEPMVETTAMEQAKYYLNESVVGDLRDMVAAGRAKNLSDYEALKEQYAAADAAGKAALEDALALAAEKAGEFTWVRYTLENYGPAVHMGGQWWNNIIHVAGIDYEDTVQDQNGEIHVAVYFEKEEYANYHVHKNYSMVGRYVHMKDALAYVDSEGEYYYDDLNGKLYYYSESGVSGKRFARGTHDYMFYFDDARNITLSGLHITGVDDAYLSHNDGVNSLGGTGAVGEPITEQVPAFDRSAIVLDDCYGFTVLGCTFDELGGRAIYGRGVLANIYVEGCSFERLGGNAVQLGNGKLEVNWVNGVCTIENVTITDNYVYDVAREYYTCSAIWLNQGKDITITHNTIDKCSYSGICVGYTFGIPKVNPGDGGWYHMYNVEIAYNYITGFMHELGDGGGIYVTGGNAPKEMVNTYFNFVHDNYILMSNTTGNGLGHMLVGIYFDGSTSNWKCYENVVVEQSYGAVSGEDEGFDLTDEEDKRYLTAQRNRYRGTTFIYIQHITSQITHNILCDSNYILNVRATEPALQQKEVYKTYVVADRNIIEQNTHYVNGVDRIPIGAEDIIYNAGSYGKTGNPEILWEGNY